MLEVPSYTAVEFLRGEIGASSAKARDLKNKIMFLRHALNSEGRLLQEIVAIDIRTRTTSWAKQTLKYMGTMGWSIEQIKSLGLCNIEKSINDWDTLKWTEGMQSKSTLRLYRSSKDKPEEIRWFRNGFKYSLMLKARSDSLKLGWRGLREDKSKDCKLCGFDSETLEHFLIDCPALQAIRNKEIILQLPRIESKEVIMKVFLLMKVEPDVSTQGLIDTLLQLWNTRDRIMSAV